MFYLLSVISISNKEILVYLISSSNNKHISCSAEDKPNSVSACDQYVAAFIHNRVQVISLDKDEKKSR